MSPSLGPTIALRNGTAMPVLGFGTYKALGDDAARSVESALLHGYRAVDTASVYANETEVGAGIRASGIGRDEIFVTTKVWNDQQGFDSTKRALNESLGKLGLDHVDLYLVHWPVQKQMEHTWRAMEELLAEGKTRAIGVCNHLPHHLEMLLDLAVVKPAVDQVEFHPWLQQPALQAFLAEHDIVLEAWAPLMKGRIGEVPELAQIAARLGVTSAQVAIAWILQQGYVAIPKSVREQRIIENADVFGFELADKDFAVIGQLDRAQRLGPDPDVYAW